MLPSAVPQSAKTAATFTITIPSQSAQVQSRNPRYVSANTQSVIITLTTVNGAPFSGSSAITAANLTPANPSCSGSPLTCTVTVLAMPGSDVFTVNTYDAQQTSSSPTTPSGHLLSTASLTINVVEGQNNTPPAPLVLNGVANTIIATFAADPHISGSQTAGYSIIGNRPYTLTVSAQDASGETIIGPGAPTYSAQSGSNAIGVAIASANTFTVQVRSFSATPVTVTITPSQGNATNVAMTTVQELWVANSGNHTVTAYAPGTNTPIAADTIDTTGGLQYPYGIAFDASGNVWVTNALSITAYVPGTNTPIGADTIPLPTNSNATSLAFDTAGHMWYVDLFFATVKAYVPGTTTPIAADTITAGLNQPFGIAFDASGNAWITNLGNNTVTAYVPGTNAPIAADTINTGLNFPAGDTFDAAGHLWVANSGNNTVTAYAPGTNTPIAADTIGASLNVPTGVAFDGAGHLWVVNDGNNTITAYTPGTNTPIAADTISAGLNAPIGLAFSP